MSCINSAALRSEPLLPTACILRFGFDDRWRFEDIPMGATKRYRNGKEGFGAAL